MLSIRCSKIKSEKELEFIEGYSWNTNKQARQEFDSLRPADTGFKVGNVCLDLIDDNMDIKDTITIPEPLFEMKRAKTQTQVRINPSRLMSINCLLWLK